MTTTIFLILLFSFSVVVVVVRPQMHEVILIVLHPTILFYSIQCHRGCVTNGQCHKQTNKIHLNLVKQLTCEVIIKPQCCVFLATWRKHCNYIKHVIYWAHTIHHRPTEIILQSQDDDYKMSHMTLSTTIYDMLCKPLLMNMAHQVYKHTKSGVQCNLGFIICTLSKFQTLSISVIYTVPSEPQIATTEKSTLTYYCHLSWHEKCIPKRSIS